MTQSDRLLIEKALRTSYTEHYLVDQLAQQAKSQQARDRLRYISKMYYYIEEYHAGVL
jgi:hypothetical protein